VLAAALTAAVVRTRLLPEALVARWEPCCLSRSSARSIGHHARFVLDHDACLVLLV
jgi:hypothetical protein